MIGMRNRINFKTSSPNAGYLALFPAIWAVSQFGELSFMVIK